MDRSGRYEVDGYVYNSAEEPKILVTGKWNESLSYQACDIEGEPLTCTKLEEVLSIPLFLADKKRSLKTMLHYHRYGRSLKLQRRINTNTHTLLTRSIALTLPLVSYCHLIHVYVLIDTPSTVAI